MPMNRWTALAAALFLEHIGGLFYMFSLLSPTLKDTFDYQQTQVDDIGWSANLGGNVGVLFGMLMDYKGARMVILLAGLFGFTGWFLLYSAVKFQWSLHNSVWVLMAIAFVQGQSQCALDAAAVPVVGKHFQFHRGSAVGLAKSFVGLSASLATQWYNGFFYENILDFVLFIAVYTLVVSMLGSLALFAPSEAECKHPRNDSTDTGVMHVFKMAYRFVYLLLVSLLVNALIGRFSTSGNTNILRKVETAVSFAVFGALLFYLGTKRDDPAASKRSDGDDLETHLLQEHGSEGTSDDDSDDVLDGVIFGEQHTLRDIPQPDSLAATEAPSAQLVHVDENELSALGDSPRGADKELEDYSLLQALARPDFYFHFFTLSVVCGSGLLLINNISQLTPVAGFDEESENDSIDKFLVSLQSLSNCLGRLLGGLLSDYALRSWGITRPYALSFSVILMSLAMFILSFGTAATLYIGTVVCGLAYGSVFAISPTLASEVFGLSYLGSIYTALAPGISMGSLLFSNMFSSIYDKHAATEDALLLQANASEIINTHHTCRKTECIQFSFLVCSGCCLASVVFCWIYGVRTKKRYALLYPGLNLTPRVHIEE